MSLFAKNNLYYGQEADLPETIPLRAGSLSLTYENGDLRYIRVGNQEIVRRVYVAIRDHNWGTIQPSLSNVQIDTQADSFRITYDVENKAGAIDFAWHGTIRGEANSTINFEMVGEARSSFKRNRIGFCILHPMEAAGVRAQITHVDGRQEDSVFPVSIAPQSFIDGKIHPVAPFTDMRAIRHQVSPELWAEIQFEGDIFEMEDQRNWIDASFKTYGTPLRLPLPILVEKGTTIRQKVMINLVGDGSTGDKTPSERLTFSLNNTVAANVPRLGLGVATHGDSPTAREIERLKALNLSHLRVDLYLDRAEFEAKLRQAAHEAKSLGVGLELALHLTDQAEAELDALRQLIDALKPPVDTWLIFHEKETSTRERWIKLAREYLRDYDPNAKIGSGTNVNFTQLNREHPPAELLDIVAYSINPTVHAIDHSSVVETLQGQAATVETARQFSGQAQIAVTPVTFKMRFNPNASGPAPEIPPGDLPPQVDPRQMSLFGAGWTVGSIKYLGENGVYSATYYETTGWRGVMETEKGSPIAERFQSIAGGVFPMYHVFADVGEFADGEIVSSLSNYPLIFDGLALRKNGALRLLLANFTGEVQQVLIPDLRGVVTVKSMDETNAEFAMRETEHFREQAGQKVEVGVESLEVSIMPFAVVRIDAGTTS
jgi:D-apionolactonase